MDQGNRMAIARVLAGLLLGWATSWVVLHGGFTLLRAAWPDYAAADPDRAYTLAMLLVRLVIFSTMIAATSAVATLAAGDKRMAWFAGLVVLAVSIPPHLYPGTVWEEYPAWYHIVYLLSIVPIAVAGGTVAHRHAPAALQPAPSAG